MVHFPLFARVGAQFTGYAADHATRTTYVVAPLMLLELISGVLLLLPAFRPHFVQHKEAIAGALLIAVIWLTTGLVQVPLHDKLQARFASADVARLVRTNWIRTVAWSLRAALVLLWVSRLLA